jgi:uncharacterized protein
MTLGHLSSADLIKLKSLMTSANLPENPKRRIDVIRYGFSTKFAYHVVRLFLECEQIMMTGDLILDRDSKLYNAIRNGEWTLERLEKYVEEKERQLEEAYHKSDLQHSPDEFAIKNLLMESLEMHYGNLSEVIRVESNADALLRTIKEMVEKYNGNS